MPPFPHPIARWMRCLLRGKVLGVCLNESNVGKHFIGPGYLGEWLSGVRR